MPYVTALLPPRRTYNSSLYCFSTWFGAGFSFATAAVTSPLVALVTRTLALPAVAVAVAALVSTKVPDTALSCRRCVGTDVQPSSSACSPYVGE